MKQKIIKQVMIFVIGLVSVMTFAFVIFQINEINPLTQTQMIEGSVQSLDEHELIIMSDTQLLTFILEEPLEILDSMNEVTTLQSEDLVLVKYRIEEDVYYTNYIVKLNEPYN